MHVPSLAARSNELLLSEIHALRKRECEYVADIVLHLSEIEQRGIYHDAGYSSLFAYCREALKYSEGASTRRVNAARCLRKNPEIYEKLKSGSLSLCSLSEVAPVITEDNKSEVLSAVEGTSRREAERVAARFGKAKLPIREKIKVRKVVVADEGTPLVLSSSSDDSPRSGLNFGRNPELNPGMSRALNRELKPGLHPGMCPALNRGLNNALNAESEKVRNGTSGERTEERVSLQFEVLKAVWNLVEEARTILGPVPVSKVFEHALQSFVTKHRALREPKIVKKTNSRSVPTGSVLSTKSSNIERRQTTRAQSAAAQKKVPPPANVNSRKSLNVRSRYIARPVKRAVIERDGGRCAYVAPDGRRCAERRGLQFDHVHPYSLGGENTAENLRLLCPAHNRLMADRVFGRMKLKGKANLLK